MFIASEVYWESFCWKIRVWVLLNLYQARTHREEEGGDRERKESRKDRDRSDRDRGDRHRSDRDRDRDRDRKDRHKYTHYLPSGFRLEFTWALSVEDTIKILLRIVW